MNRRKFLSLLGTGFLISFFTGCGETSEKNSVGKTENKVASKIAQGDFFMEDIKLNSGYTMPVIGLGTWTLNNNQAENSVYHALSVGYRLIDTARYYGNEVGVGRGVKKAIDDRICKREDIFITSKIMPSDYNNAAQAIENSIADLNLEYVDLMLVHQPGTYDEQAYQSLEKFAETKKIRSIGISNYYTPQDFDRINNIAKIVPAVVQNENHLFYQNTALQEYLKKFNTVIESWYPFGGRANTHKVLKNPVVMEIANAHQKTAAQIILRWQIQAGYIAIPGSKNPAHIEENINIFDFELSQDDMKKIAALNQNQRFENW